MDFAVQFLQMAAALALVVGLLLALSYGLKRFGWPLSKNGGTSGLQILERRFLTNKHSLVLVRVGDGQRFLIGVSPNRMEVLASFAPQPEDPGTLSAQEDMA
ncbi:flagellar biosynthetic protein FliO [Desulfacinum hydrothermale DSM 13146]|uniref:Flagellar biosynthetic protein FliO n=1 Tax=Desulfacinum hydrothermale DSM 13146 TaxID=1121390 RepID=A0A1W1X695_9BACT|nr:flagellar biosynthetic protein FliO [Desulfacinum hydrothermale]SMC19347.1 flagellar biosynthetic protein FliO [Desulfacinum hydrothermale DSM 13146]